jgi:elongation factor G
MFVLALPDCDPEDTSGKLECSQDDAKEPIVCMCPLGLTPSVAYRETVRYAASGERKYIRYFDGRGHFGHIGLQLMPRPGECCSVSVDAACPLPEESCTAIKRALARRFEHGPVRYLPLIGFEVRLMGGSYLPRHSYPEACAIAACMAYDEAMRRAGPVLVEPYVGVRLLVETGSLQRTVDALTALLGEVRAIHSVTDVAWLEVQIPTRLQRAVRSELRLPFLETFPLPKEQQYRPLSGSAVETNHFSDLLDDWT